MGKKVMYTTLILFLILAFAFSASAEDVERAARFNINGRTGDDFIGQAGILYPIRSEENSLWYTDLRYRMSEDDVDEWNFGLGYRYKQDNAKNHIAGAYLFRDRREEYDHYWDMWTVGGEILTDQWDFRINGYIADNDKTLAPDAVVGGNSVEVNNNRELVLVLGNEVYYTAMDGLDIEVGKRFTETDSIFKNVGVYAKLYRFFESDTPTITGRQIRVDKKFGDINNINWSIGARWRDDNIRESETEATFAVSIPFGKGSAAGKDIKDVSPEDIIEARMTEQPERDLDVVVGKSVSENAAAGQEIIIKNPVLEESLKVWYVTKNGNYTGEGSKNDPININSILDSIIEPKPGDIIILSGKDGDISLSTRELALEDSQQLISKRGYAVVKAEVGEEYKLFKFKPDVEQATLIGEASGGRGMISPSKNNVISGINLVNESTTPYTIAQYVDGHLNINNNNFYFTAENIEEGFGIHAYGPKPTVFEINIVDNKFYNNTTSSKRPTAILVGNFSSKDKITITGNEISGFKTTDDYFLNPEYTSAIRLKNIYTSNTSDDYFINIKDNHIIDYNYGIVFESYNHDNVSLSIEDYYQSKNIFESTVEVDEVKIMEIFE